MLSKTSPPTPGIGALVTGLCAPACSAALHSPACSSVRYW